MDAETLRKLHEAATTAPWAFTHHSDEFELYDAGIGENGELYPGCEELYVYVCNDSLKISKADLELITYLRNHAPEIATLKARCEALEGALDWSEAWVRWARGKASEKADIDSIDECLEQIASALASNKAEDTEEEAIERQCQNSPDGRHQVDTSMEEGPNNCFHCGADMRADQPRGGTKEGE